MAVADDPKHQIRSRAPLFLRKVDLNTAEDYTIESKLGLLQSTILTFH
jgi:hypothetical protein